MAKRKAVNGAKKCTGPCGRTLALYMYRSNGHGYLTSQCLQCHRATERERRKRRYHSDQEYREKYKAARKARYWSNEEYRKRQIRLATIRKQRARDAGESREKEIARWRLRYQTDNAFRERIKARNKAYRLLSRGAA